MADMKIKNIPEEKNGDSQLDKEKKIISEKMDEDSQLDKEKKSDPEKMDGGSQLDKEKMGTPEIIDEDSQLDEEKMKRDFRLDRKKKSSLEKMRADYQPYKRIKSRTEKMKDDSQLNKKLKEILEKIKEEPRKAILVGSIVVAVGISAVIAFNQLGSDSAQPIQAESIESNQSTETTKDNQYIEDGVVTNPDDILVVVNDNRKLPDGFVPQDLLVPNVAFSFSGIEERSHLRKEAAEALEELFALAEQDGIELFAVSGYRSYERQAQIFDRNVEARGFEDASKFSAQAGHSEHQTGLAIDVSSRSVNLQITQDFGATVEGQWLAENAHRAGFIIRYLEGNEDITGFAYEPWHIRYVGDIAEDIFEQGITLEEFLGIK